MAWGNGNLGGGGGGFNYKVVGGTSRPSNPKENMIWVNTDVEITSHIFSATQPENPVEGMVWFAIGTSSNAAFNALKKNTLTVYPTACKQYVSGAWVSKTAKTYQGGKWVDWWSGQLYTPGNEWESFTGGWVTAAKKSNSSASQTATAPTVTRNANSIAFSQTTGNAGIAYCATKIDLKNVSTITALGSFKNGGNSDRHLRLVVCSNLGTYVDTDVAAETTSTSGNTITSMSCDVSALSGTYYVGFYIAQASSITLTSMYVD